MTSGCSGGVLSFFWLRIGALVVIISTSSSFLTDTLVRPNSRHRFCRSGFWSVFKALSLGTAGKVWIGASVGHFAPAQFEVAGFQETWLFFDHEVSIVDLSSAPLFGRVIVDAELMVGNIIFFLGVV